MNVMNERTTNPVNFWISIGMLLPAGAVLIMVVYLGWYSRLMADDYCSIYIGEDRGLLRSVWYWYHTWHGGFSASVADWLLSFLGADVLPYMTFIFVAGWLVVAIFAIREGLNWWGVPASQLLISVSLGLLLVFTTLAISPRLQQSLFWWGGARGYLSPLILYTLYIALYFRYSSSSWNRLATIAWIMVSFSLVFIIGGFSETFTPVQLVLFAGAIAWIWLTGNRNMKDPTLHFLIVGFVGAILSLIVMVMAPGNSIRQTYFPSPPTIITILKVSFDGYLYFLSTILLDLASFAGISGSTLGAIWLGMRSGRNTASGVPRMWHFIIPLLIGIVLAFACFPPAVFGTSQPPPPRTWVIPAYILVVSFLVSGFLMGNWIRRHVMHPYTMTYIVPVLAILFIVFASVVVFEKLYSMLDVHVEFAELWDQVDKDIRVAKQNGLTEVQIPSLINWANLQYPGDRPKYWPNVCYSEYYDIQVIAPPLE
jgi:hypothetical protein